ncbi:MAG TPA: GspH/FimT family pseudopilin [Rhodocyclaceae bacterium]|nr:GspH/FimT family pseudopilin [Rhodocyclaceae bacterium]HRQ46443.1 GspH/FimT family pseudopilin [Rhodocyclaceae bacterium]
MKKEHGFTLIELLLAITVLAVLLGIGVPSFQETIRTNRTATLTNDLVAALQFARSEAIRRGQNVMLCAGNDFTDCNGDWLDGWFITSDPTTASAVIRVWPAPRAGAEFGGGATLTYNTIGATGANVAFDIQFDGCAGTGARNVQINQMGRVVTESAACF